MNIRPCQSIAGALLLSSAAVCGAAVKTERVEYTVGGQVMEGVLAYDDAKTQKVPGVLVCPEWWGCNQYGESRAKMLAEEGYVAFAIDMYGKGKQTTDPKQAAQWAGEVMKDVSVLRERAAGGLKVLAENARVDTKNLAAIGYCMGGTVALELARSGKPQSENLKVVAPFHAGTLLAEHAADNKNIKGTVAVFHGADDKFVPEGDVEKFHEQMKSNGVDYLFVSFGGAVHSFTNPNADKAGIPGVKHQKNADERSWSMLEELLEEKFEGVKEPAGEHKADGK